MPLQEVKLTERTEQILQRQLLASALCTRSVIASDEISIAGQSYYTPIGDEKQSARPVTARLSLRQSGFLPLRRDHVTYWTGLVTIRLPMPNPTHLIFCADLAPTQQCF